MTAQRAEAPMASDSGTPPNSYAKSLKLFLNAYLDVQRNVCWRTILIQAPWASNAAWTTGPQSSSQLAGAQLQRERSPRVVSLPPKGHRNDRCALVSGLS